MLSNHIIIRFLCVTVLVYIFHLIHGHKLRLGHSWFLFLMGLGLFVIGLFPGVTDILCVVTGTKTWLLNVMVLMVAFLFVIVVHSSLMISGLAIRVKELSQELAIIDSEMGFQENSGKTTETEIAKKVS